MKYRQSLFVVGVLIVVASQSLCLSAKTIRMGYFILPPHQYMENAESTPKGVSITYFEAVASQMGDDVEWVGPLPLPRLTAYLKNGELDGTVGFPKYQTFETFLYYPDTSVFLGHPILIVQKENPLTQIRSIEDIRGYRIGLVKSASGLYTPLIDDHRDVITVEELGGDTWIEQNIKKLFAGRLDALFDRQSYTIPFVVAKLNLGPQIKVLPLPDPPTPLYVVFSKASKQGKILLDRYNAITPQVFMNYEELAQQAVDAVTQHQ